MDSNTTVGVVGAGMVGMSFAYSLMQSGLAGRIVLVDRDTARAEGEAMDLNHGLPFVGPMRISQGDYADLAGAAVTVVCAGASQRPGQSRLDLLKHNAAVIRDVSGRTAAANPGGILLIASNPVDLLTWIAAEESGLAPGRVFGSGTVLDTARLRYLLAEHYAVDPRSVHAWVIGEHGDHSVPVWSIANIAGVPLSDFRTPQHTVHDPAVLDEIARHARPRA
jgi:L-lactate dehydrogenase